MSTECSQADRHLFGALFIDIDTQYRTASTGNFVSKATTDAATRPGDDSCRLS